MLVVLVCIVAISGIIGCSIVYVLWKLEKTIEANVNATNRLAFLINQPNSCPLVK